MPPNNLIHPKDDLFITIFHQDSFLENVKIQLLLFIVQAPDYVIRMILAIVFFYFVFEMRRNLVRRNLEVFWRHLRDITKVALEKYLRCDFEHKQCCSYYLLVVLNLLPHKGLVHQNLSLFKDETRMLYHWN